MKLKCLEEYNIIKGLLFRLSECQDISNKMASMPSPSIFKYALFTFIREGFFFMKKIINIENFRTQINKL